MSTAVVVPPSPGSLLSWSLCWGRDSRKATRSLLFGPNPPNREIGLNKLLSTSCEFAQFLPSGRKTRRPGPKNMVTWRKTRASCARDVRFFVLRFISSSRASDHHPYLPSREGAEPRCFRSKASYIFGKAFVWGWIQTNANAPKQVSSFLGWMVPSNGPKLAPWVENWSP